jgi:hypothetical protein
MPSVSFGEWRSTRARALDEIARGHAAVSGTRRGRRFNTQQFNRAYAVMLAAQFQGFCRDLHSECVDHIVGMIPSPLAVRPLVLDEFMRDRKLDRGNAQTGSLGADFHRYRNRPLGQDESIRPSDRQNDGAPRRPESMAQCDCTPGLRSSQARRHDHPSAGTGPAVAEGL